MGACACALGYGPVHWAWVLDAALGSIYTQDPAELMSVRDMHIYIYIYIYM